MRILIRHIMILGLGLLQLAGGLDSLRAQDELEIGFVRRFDSTVQDSFINDKNYVYDRKIKSKVNSNSARAKRSLNEFLFKPRMGKNGLLEILFYAFGIIAVIYIALSLMGLKPMQIFRSRSKDISLEYELEHTDIIKLNFEGLLRETLAAGEYRKAVRLLYLETLKKLTDKKHIQWRVYKTNQDYQRELGTSKLRHEFADLTLSYEYVWYGNFPIDKTGFEGVEDVFRKFQKKV